METRVVCAKKAKPQGTVLVNFHFLIVVQWRVKLAPGAKIVVNASKPGWTTVETPSVHAKYGQRPNFAIFTSLPAIPYLDSSQIAVQMCQQVPGVINATNARRLKC